MKIRADGFVARMAYPKGLPDRVNLCPLFWRFVFLTFVVRPVLLPFGSIIGSICAFLVNGSYVTPNFKYCDFEEKYIRNWPRMDDDRLSPFFIIVALGGVLSLLSLLLIAIVILSRAANYFLLSFSVIGVVVVAIVVGIAMTAVLLRRVKTAQEIWSLAKEFVRAKYRKVCPQVEVIRDPR